MRKQLAVKPKHQRDINIWGFTWCKGPLAFDFEGPVQPFIHNYYWYWVPYGGCFPVSLIMCWGLFNCNFAARFLDIPICIHYINWNGEVSLEHSFFVGPLIPFWSFALPRFQSQILCVRNLSPVCDGVLRFSCSFNTSIPKLKIVKNSSLVLLHCAFTMWRPKMHSINQWWSL